MGGPCPSAALAAFSSVPVSTPPLLRLGPTLQCDPVCETETLLAFLLPSQAS